MCFAKINTFYYDKIQFQWIGKLYLRKGLVYGNDTKW